MEEISVKSCQGKPNLRALREQFNGYRFYIRQFGLRFESAPSILLISPFMKELSSLNKNWATLAISSILDIRPRGDTFVTREIISGCSAQNEAALLLYTYIPGLIPLTLRLPFAKRTALN